MYATMRRWAGEARWLAVVLSAAVGSLTLAADGGPAHGDETMAPRQVVGAIVEVAASGPIERDEALRMVVRERVDLDGVAKRALGRNWHAATAEQRTEYLALFEDLVLRRLRERLIAHPDARLELRGSRRAGPDGAVVLTRLVRERGRALPVDWRLRRSGEGWRVHDVVVDGLSVTVLHQREFARAIRAGGMPALLETMRARSGRTA